MIEEYANSVLRMYERFEQKPTWINTRARLIRRYVGFYKRNYITAHEALRQIIKIEDGELDYKVDYTDIVHK